MKPLRRTVIALVLFAAAAPVWGYVVMLKDGSQIITREKYRRDGDKVVLVLQSGTETFIDASEVDFKKTDELNTIHLGQARVIEEGRAETVIDEQPGKRSRPESLSEIAGRTNLSLPRADEQEEARQAALPLTPAGFVDLQRVDRVALADAEVAGEIGGYLSSQGAEGFQLFQGTAEKHVLLEMTADSEASVFEQLRDAAGALAQVQSRFPNRVEVLELLLVTSSGKRAGQFALTGDLARELLSGALEAPTFFHRYVQF